jgi:hypothetical protein
MMKVGKKQQAKWDKRNMDQSNGHSANNLEREGWVKDRKTGEWYNPKERFDQLMDKPEIQAVFKRLSIR